MRKRNWLWILVGVIVLLGGRMSVKADVIWEPADPFYENHLEECTVLSRTYTANGPDGKVTLYESPESATITGSLENGQEAFISFTYTDKKGTVWGVYETDDYSYTGWMPMEYMTVKYDYISFSEDHAKEIKTQNGTAQIDNKVQEVNFWKYPGSEEKESVDIADTLTIDYGYTYIDEIGHQWGFVYYYYGWKNYWICLDSPTAEFDELYQDHALQTDESKENDETLAVDDKKDTFEKQEVITPDTSKQKGMVWKVAGIVLAVIVVTGMLLIWMKEEEKDEK